jgi:hypothetical protein
VALDLGMMKRHLEFLKTLSDRHSGKAPAIESAQRRIAHLKRLEAMGL